MVLYTTMPLEEIFKLDQEEQKESYMQIPYSRGLIEVQLTSSATAIIVRLLSSDLNDYLLPELQPGTEIRLRWNGVQ